jgi:hypothetical protein
MGMIADKIPFSDDLIIKLEMLMMWAAQINYLWTDESIFN